MLKRLLNFILQKLKPSPIPDHPQSPQMLAARAELARMEDELLLALLADGTTQNISSQQIKACVHSLRQKRARAIARMHPEEP